MLASLHPKPYLHHPPYHPRLARHQAWPQWQHHRTNPSSASLISNAPLLTPRYSAMYSSSFLGYSSLSTCSGMSAAAAPALASRS